MTEKVSVVSATIRNIQVFDEIFDQWEEYMDMYICF